MKKFYAPLFALLFFVSLSAQVAAQIQPATLRQIQSLLEEKDARTPVQRKIDSRLLQAFRESRGQKMASGVTLEAANVRAEKDGLVKLDIRAVVTDELLTKIEGAGGKIVYASPQYNTVRIQINLSKVEAVAAYPQVKFVEPAVESITVGSGKPDNGMRKEDPKTGIDLSGVTANRGGFAPHKPTFEQRAQRVRNALEKYMLNHNNFFAPFTGTVNSQGDRAHRADDVRNTYGYAGQGIKIGVLSDSYNALGVAAADVANGNLPGVGNPLGNTTPVTVLADFATGADEGRAMLQIVHDLAPKAQLFFATANISEASFASNIIALRNAPNNCDIIIDDIFYYDEPVFQDGIVAQAVNTVTASGALYFSSAGNEGSVAKGTAGVWEGDFNDAGSLPFAGSTKPGSIHNFGTGAAPVNGDIVSAIGNRYTLNWSDPAYASSNDYDLFLVSSTGVVKASSTNIQSGTQSAYESITPLMLVAGDRLVVFKAWNAQARAFSINTVRGRLTLATIGQTHGHSSAVNAFSVSATPAAAPNAAQTAPGPYPNAFGATNQVEAFTSDGPRRMFYNADGTPITPGNLLFSTNGGNVRAKPDITAADGVATTLASGGGLNPFYGTSAAAPHAGAIAALLKSANPALTYAQIKSILISTALDIESTGYDNVSGSGIVQAFQAMQAVNPPALGAVALGTVTTTEGNFNNGNGAIDPGETGNVVVQLTNPSLAPVSNVVATLTTTTPGVTIIRGTSLYGSIPPSGSMRNNGTPFQIGLSNTIPCGTVINFVVTVTFNGGPSPQAFLFTVTAGSQLGATISSTLGSTPPSGTGWTGVTGSQTGRLNRNTPVSSCGVQKATPILAATTGARAYDAYTFTNTTSGTICVTVAMNSSGGINLYTAAYSDSGFVPATPNLHFLGDQGSSAASQTFAVNVAAGKQYTIVVSEVTGATAVGTAYTLSTSYTVCAPSPACSPVVITTPSLAAGTTGSPYSQVIAVSGGSGSGSYTYALTGNLPAGLSLTGNSLTGTPTQAGTFTFTVTATDPAGCPAGSKIFMLTIGGNPPVSVAPTYGTPQSVYLNNTYTQMMQATVKDAGGNPLPGVKVVFVAPTTGASGLFTGGRQNDTALTNNNGVATSAALTANATIGGFQVTANVNGIPWAIYNLVNFCPTALVVTSSADSGPGTLREIVNNACPGINVTFDPGVNIIQLTGGELLINKAITITGPGPDKLTISGTGNSRIFNIVANTATVNLSGMTLRDGKVPANATLGGGAILINNGSGAGPVNISRCVITGNDLSLPANSLGGGIDNEGGTVTIDRTSIVNNVTTYRGGAIQNQGFGSMVITNSTIAGNTAGIAGIGGAIRSFLPLTITNSTFYGNAAQTAGNLSVAGGTATIRNTIIGGGALLGTGGAGPDINGPVISADYNLIENTASGTITGVTTRNIVGVNANLLPIDYYRSVTPVLLPRSNSVVVNNGDSTLVLGLDQRDMARVLGRKADIGAVETNYLYVTSGGTPQTTSVSRPFTMPLQAKIVEAGIPVAGDTVFFRAPATGASGTFPGGALVAAAVSNNAGLATSPVFTANGITGRYNVTGSIGAEFNTINFDLTNAILNAVFGTGNGATAQAENGLKISAYPNPVRETLVVQTSGNDRQLVTIHDVLGRQMMSQQFSAGRHEISVKSWAKGLYTLTVMQQGKLLYTVKVMKD